MLEEHTIISKFRKDVNEHVDIIEDEIRRGRRNDASLWLNELFTMKMAWEREFNRPGLAITAHPWVNPKTLDTSSTKHLAKIRIEILQDAIKKVEDMFEAQGWREAA